MLRHNDRTFEPIPTVAELEALATTFEAVGQELNIARLEGFLKEALEAANSRQTRQSPAQPAQPQIPQVRSSEASEVSV